MNCRNVMAFIWGHPDESTYLLLADVLTISNMRTGEDIQAFLLKDDLDEALYFAYMNDAESLSNAFIVEDLNFDGYLDFRIIEDAGVMVNYSYRYWTWNPEIDKYEIDEILGSFALSAPAFNQEERTITSTFESEHEAKRYVPFSLITP